jgi:hypothetical protein
MARGVQFEHVPALELLPGAGRHVDVVEVSSAHAVDAWLTTTEAEGRLLLLEARAKEYEIEVLLAGHNVRPKHYVVHLLHTGEWKGHDHSRDTALSVRVTEK